MKDSVLDGVRIEDKQKVVFKRIRTDSDELQIFKRLSAASLRGDPRNRTIPVLDIFEHSQDPFHCRSEFVEAMRQYLEGLQFMHDNHIAHRDIAPKNMMMEESRVVPKGSHFTNERTHVGTLKSFWWKKRCSVDGDSIQYHFIDFGFSEYYPDSNEDAKTLGRMRGFEEIPEMSLTVPYNPFKVDLYMFGMMMLNIIKTYPGLDIFRPVGEKMCRQNPDERLTAEQALACLDEIAHGLSRSQLSAAIWRTGDTLLHRFTRTLCGCYWFDPMWQSS
ncbi:kinase-like domain-containing protein [Mycena crocata]|nr:kinase-like domain-containing protein [Mycena crocata]